MGTITAMFGVRSFTFHRVEYLDALDLRGSGAKSWEEGCMSGFRHVEFEALLNSRCPVGTWEVSVGQGKRIWQTHIEVRVETMEQIIGQKQGRTKLDL